VMPPRRLPARTRAAAWLVTGPVGHTWGGLADWVVLAVRWRRAHPRPRGGSGDP